MAIIKCEYTESYCKIDKSEILSESVKVKACNDHWRGGCDDCEYWQFLTKKFEKSCKQYELCIDSEKDCFGCIQGFLRIGRKEIDLSDVDFLEIDGKVYINEEDK